MGIPFFQQQSAAYNAHLKRNLTIFTPDGRRYQIEAQGKSYKAYAEEVQEYLAPFEVEVLLAQRDSLRDALARRYLIQHFDLGGDAHFAGMEMDSVIDELKQRGITLSAIKSAMRGTVTRIAGEIKNAWPIRESGRNLQYTSYDLVFDAIEAKTAAKRKKIWETVAAWAATSSLPTKEGARLATLQDWDETGDGHTLRVDLHHYPRPDLDSCRAITLLDAAERNKDMDILRQALAQNGVELGDIAVNTHAAPHNAQPRTAAPANEPAPPDAQDAAPSTQDSALSAPTLSDTLAAVRIERDRMSRQLELLSVALADSEERQRQARHIESLEKLLSSIADTLDNLAWPNKPSEWTKFSSVEKGRHIMKAFEHTLSTLSQYEKSLQIAKSEIHVLATELREARKSHEQWQKRAEAELRETRESRDQWQKRAENIESATREEMQKQHEAAMLAQELDFTRKLSAENAAKLELQKQHDAALLAQERDFARKMTIENANREELLKQHEAALLAQEIDFTRKMQNMQQERMREAQQLRDNHLRQMEELQDDHLKQIQKLRRLMPSEDALHIAEDGSKPLPAAASKLSRYKAESQEIFDSRIGEYLRIAKDQGLGQADEWLLAEAKKLAETRAQQNYLGV
ncbi:MAG: hypothetical protein WC091_21740 [Sulfuricellaceae bacterium]